MPTIELTDEQAAQLRDVIIYECDRLDEDIRSSERMGGADDPGAIQYRHERSVLSDILHLLEIA